MYVTSSLGDASYLNPILSTDSASSAINNLIFNGLIKYDKDIKLTGDLAQSWSVTDYGKTIVFHLRKGVSWHDGKPFSAEDVKFTYERLIDPLVKTPYGSDYQLIKRFEVIDPHTIRITYAEPFVPALESWGIGIIPKHIFKNGDFNAHPANRNPIGTGPYKFVSWKTDEKILLAPNPDYFEGAPLLGRHMTRIIPDQSVEFLELRNESIDSAGLTPDQWNAYPEFFKNYNKYRYPSFSYTYLGFNLVNPLFKDKRFRQAIAHCIDKKEIIDGVLLGMGKSATGPFPPQSWAYDPTVSDHEYNPQKGKALFESLGWKDTDNDGWLDNGTSPLAFTIMTNQGNKLRSLSAEIIQSQLRKSGIKVSIRIIEWSAFIKQFIEKQNFDAVILGWSLSRDPDQYAIWHSSQREPGRYNFVSYVNPEVDQMLEEGRRTFNNDQRQKIYRRIHRTIAADIPYLFLYYPESLVAVHKRFRGQELAPAGIGWNFYTWWVPQEEQKYRMLQ